MLTNLILPTVLFRFTDEETKTGSLSNFSQSLQVMSGRSEIRTSVPQVPRSRSYPTTSHHCLHHYHQQPRPLGWSADLPFSLSESPSGSCQVRQRWLSAKPHGRFKDDLTAGAASGNWSFGRASLALFTSNSEDSSLALPPPLFLTLLTYSHMLQTKEPSRASLKTGSPRKGLSQKHMLKTRGR